MKNSIRLLAFAGLGLAASANVALAAPSPDTVCLSQLQELKFNGYVDNSVYTTEGITQILRASNLVPNFRNWVAPGETFRVSYNCYVDHQLAHMTLNAMPVGGAPYYRTVVGYRHGYCHGTYRHVYHRVGYYRLGYYRMMNHIDWTATR